MIEAAKQVDRNDAKPAEQTSRRTFIKHVAATGAVLAAGAAVSGRAMGADPRTLHRAVSSTARRVDKLRLAFIGTDGIGGYHLDSTKELGVTCPCFCDVDTDQMGTAAEMYPDAKRYQDYRVMFEKERDNFDAVMIGVPDHHHYPATILAMQLGKHVYTQKPLTHTPWEARQLEEAARKYKVATQMGNQGHAAEGWRLVYEWIHSGALGSVIEAHTWTNRPGNWWPQGMGRPEETDPVPASLNWDVWLGPAPERPFKGPKPGEKNGPYHRFNWRGWWDFGCGALGDMACHTMDGVFWALDPGHAISVEPVAMTLANSESFPTATAIKWTFGAKYGHRPSRRRMGPRPGKRRAARTVERPAFCAYWYDGGLRPPFPQELEFGRRMPSTGNLFIGTKASMLVSGDYGHSPRIFPETRMKEIGKPPKLLERSPGHIDEWIMAAKGEKPIDFPKSNFAYAGPMTETILLGNIALRVGRRLEWDGNAMRFTNCDEANQYVTKEYREGWKF